MLQSYFICFAILKTIKIIPIVIATTNTTSKTKTTIPIAIVTTNTTQLQPNP